MYNGYTETPEQIAARKARILKGYEPPKGATHAPAGNGSAEATKSGGRKPSGSLGDGRGVSPMLKPIQDARCPSTPPTFSEIKKLDSETFVNCCLCCENICSSDFGEEQAISDAVNYYNARILCVSGENEHSHDIHCQSCIGDHPVSKLFDLFKKFGSLDRS